MSQYLIVSKSPLYSFIFTLPLFLLYEVGIFLISSRDINQLRNGADVLMRQVLESFGIYGMYGFGGTFLIGFLIAFLRQKKNLRTSEIESRFLLIMFFVIPKYVKSNLVNLELIGLVKKRMNYLI